jgi:hypothetical protein
MTDQLLVRPKVRVDEWWLGYRARLLVANGNAREDLRQLECVNSDLDGRDREHCAHADLGGRPGRWGRFVVPGWAVLGKRCPASYCPLCWQEDAYFRLEWRLKTVDYCRRHGCSLCTECPKCHRDLDVVDVAMGACRLGHRLDRWSERAEPAPVAQLVMEVDGLTCATDEKVASYLLLTRLAQQIAGRIEADLRTPKGVLTRLLQAWEGCRVALCVETLRDLFGGLTDDLHLDEALHLLLHLHRAELDQETVMSSLPIWDLASLLVSRGASTRCSVDQGLIDRHALKARDARLGMGPATDQRWRMSVSWDREPVIRDDALLCAPSHQVALRDFSEWRERRALEAEPIISGGSVRMHPREFEEYLHEVSRVARPLAVREEAAISLDNPQLWATKNSRQVARVLDSLRSGDLPVWIRPDRSGLSRFYVGSRVVRMLDRYATRSWRRPPESQLSLPF